MTGTPHTIAPGARLGQYEVVRLVGSGGMGGVYEARHVTLKKRVAVKIMYPNFAVNAELVTRFMREGEAAARVRHPHVVDVSDVGVNDGVPFLVMEFLEGEDLRTMLDREGKLTLEQGIAIIVPVLSALLTAHHAGVVHRDLKPENIFLTRDRGGVLQPKVLDFGISKLIDPLANAAMTRTTAIMGTPFYMSPEQTASGKNVDARTDQYSLAVVLYECVTGKLPYETESLFDLMQAIVKGNVLPPSTVQTTLPKPFDRVLLRAMHRDPAQRYRSLGVLARALLDFADEKTKLHWMDEFARDPVPTPAPSSATALAHNATIASDVPVPPVPKVQTRAPSEAQAAVSTATVLHDAAPTSTMSSALAAATVVSDEALAPNDALSSRIIVDDARDHPSDNTLASLFGPRRGWPRWPFAVGLLVCSAAFLWIAFPPPAKGKRQHADSDRPPVAESPEPSHTTLPPLHSFHIGLVVSPPNALIQLDGQDMGSGSFARDVALDGTVHNIRVAAVGYESQTITFRDEPPPSSVVLAQMPAAPPVAPNAPPAEHPLPRVSIAPTHGVARVHHTQPQAATGSSESGANGAPILH